MEAVTAPDGRSAVPGTERDTVLATDERGVATSLAGRLGVRRPIVAGGLVWVLGYVVLAIVLVLLGLVLTEVLLPEGLRGLDESVSRWFVQQRTPTFNDLTLVGSELASTGAIVGVAALAVIVLAIGKHWRQIGFLVAALALEFSVFLTATFLIDRQRPAVPRLDPAPVTSSYPSGHVAASITLYLGLAIVVLSLVRSTLVRAIAWTVALVVPVAVAISRVYRGMHHMTDVTASLVLASGALVFALLATRTAVATAEREDEHTSARPDVEVAA